MAVHPPQRQKLVVVALAFIALQFASPDAGQVLFHDIIEKIYVSKDVDEALGLSSSLSSTPQIPPPVRKCLPTNLLFFGINFAETYRYRYPIRNSLELITLPIPIPPWVPRCQNLPNCITVTPGNSLRETYRYRFAICNFFKLIRLEFLKRGVPPSSRESKSSQTPEVNPLSLTCFLAPPPRKRGGSRNPWKSGMLSC